MDVSLVVLAANAAAAGLLCLIAWLASHVVRRPSIVHALWALALLKLVTPPLLPVPLLPLAPLASGAPAAPAPEPTTMRLSDGTASASVPVGSVAGALAGTSAKPDGLVLISAGNNRDVFEFERFTNLHFNDYKTHIFTIDDLGFSGISGEAFLGIFKAL